MALQFRNWTNLSSDGGIEAARPCQGRVGRVLEEVDDGNWPASFMHDDLGYFDLEQKTLQPLDNPFGTRLSPMS
jgi:hypothetical protein